MWDAQKQVAEFHDKYGHPASAELAVPKPEEVKLRIKLIEEEARETCDALDGLHTGLFSMTDVADGLADLAYVVLGTAVTLGIDLEHVFNEVHRSNMTKAVAVRLPGEKYATGGGKGPGYTPPDLQRVLYGN